MLGQPRFPISGDNHITVKFSLVTETQASRADVESDDGPLFRAWRSIALSRGLEGGDDGVGVSHAVADEHPETGRVSLFGDVVVASPTDPAVPVDSDRFDYLDSLGRLWDCRIELSDTDVNPDMERSRQSVSAIEKQVRRLFPARSRVSVLELASSWSLFEATVKVPRIAGKVVVRLARVSMLEPSDVAGWGERVESPDHEHRWYFGNDGMDESSFDELVNVARTRLIWSDGAATTSVRGQPRRDRFDEFRLDSRSDRRTFGPATEETMAKLIYSTITSLDGYVADEAGNFDWSAPDEDVHAAVNDLMRTVGTQLYGRRLYEVMLAWETFDLVDEPEVVHDFATLWRASEKVVFSTTLQGVSSERTRIERSFVPPVIEQLKASADRDLVVGGPHLAAQALAAGLVDELHFFVSPVVVGGGTRALPDGIKLTADLLGERTFANGVVHLGYAVRT